MSPKSTHSSRQFTVNIKDAFDKVNNIRQILFPCYWCQHRSVLVSRTFRSVFNNVAKIFCNEFGL